MARLRRSARQTAGTSGPHAFVEPEDPRLGLALGAAGGAYDVGSVPAALTVADASLRPSRCGMAGCGKPREDPIHWPSE